MWRDAEMGQCSFFPEAPYTGFDIYVFIEPSAEGVLAVEYKLQGPAGHFMFADEPASIVSGAVLGTPYGPPGISADLLTCQTEMVWVWRVTCMAHNLEPGSYLLYPHDDTGFRGVSICSDGHPMVEAPFLGEYGYNTIGFCFIATEESSWGTIKSLYK